MALVPLLKNSEFSEADQPVLEAGEKAYGKVLNTWAAIGNSPGLFATYLPFLRQVNSPGMIDVRIKELSAVRIAVLNHCRYTTSHRCASAKANGIADKELIAVAHGEFEAFTEQEKAALELADAMTLAVPATPREQNPSAVAPTLLADAGRLFSPGQLVELTMSISMWNALSRFHRVMGLELDMPEPPREVEELL